MSKHEGGWWLITGGKITPSEVGLDSSIWIVAVKVWFKQVGICKGQHKACLDAAKVD